MKASRFLALLLAAGLALSLRPALAAGDPWVEISAEEDGSLTVSLDGLSGDCWGVQVTLALDQAAADGFAFDQAFYGPGVYCKAAQDGGQMTVYVVSKSALNEGAALRLGSLPGSCAVTGASDLRLLGLSSLESEAYPSPALSQQGQSGGQTQPAAPDQPGNQTQGAVPGQTGGQTPPASQGGSSTPLRYRVEIPTGLQNGSIQASALLAEAGGTVTLTVLPAAGWVLERLTITDGAGREIAWTDLGDGRYRFTMPRSHISVQADFAEAGGGSETQTPVVPAVLPFLDVPSTMWYYGAVSYAYEHGLMNGVGESLFNPDGATTRAQIVTMLHRLEGEPVSIRHGSFTDAPPEMWYAYAVDWAAENGIVDGYGNGLFGPDDQVTREQMAAIFYRYARFKGYDTSAAGSLAAFSDLDCLSGWAAEAMEWANGSGLITGKSAGTLDPLGSTTRAEVATILMRFRERFAA